MALLFLHGSSRLTIAIHPSCAHNTHTTYTPVITTHDGSLRQSANARKALTTLGSLEFTQAYYLLSFSSGFSFVAHY
ncbi:MAG: hypothetical protein J3R72DRAFT_437223 [Linnemannia gamsii]|nr:MAG: hypothetical protein J3R72DRAFT_437223 [Linnemannia gamsii]